MFKTARYGLIEGGMQPSCEVLRKYPFVSNTETVISTTLGIILEVLCGWTETRKVEDCWRLWLLDSMIKILGEDVIFMDGTWEIFRSTTRLMIFKKYTPKFMTDRQYFIPFEDSLRTIAQSQEWNECRMYADNMWSILWMILNKGQGGVHVDVKPFSLDQQLSTMEHLEDPQNKEQVRCGHLFLMYIREALEVIYEEVDPNQASELQDFIKSDLNKNCPFRDCTPDFLRMSGEEGPYYKDRIKTEAGIFSAILWRAITLHSQFSEVEHAVFHDIADWEKNKEGMPNVTSYICKPNVLGTATLCDPSFARKYW